MRAGPFHRSGGRFAVIDRPMLRYAVQDVRRAAGERTLEQAVESCRDNLKMLVTFRSNAWGNGTMFGDVAVTLLKLMGHSGTVPSVLLARDIPSALARLKQGLAAFEPEDAGPQDQPAGDEKDDEPPPVGLSPRAYPLIEMLSAAQGSDVMWQVGEPPL